MGVCVTLCVTVCHCDCESAFTFSITSNVCHNSNFLFYLKVENSVVVVKVKDKEPFESEISETVVCLHVVILILVGVHRDRLLLIALY